MSIQIRMATAADAEACVEIYAPVVRSTSISFETEPPTVPEMEARISEYLEHAPWLIYEEDGRVLGYAYGSKFRPRAAYRWNVEASTYLALEARSRGVGSLLAELLIDLLRFQGFQSLYGVIALPNPASERLSEKFGMKQVGLLPKAGHKNGAWHDVALWHMELNLAVATPAEPKSMAECMESPEWQVMFAAANTAIQAGS